MIIQSQESLLLSTTETASLTLHGDAIELYYESKARIKQLEDELLAERTLRRTLEAQVAWIADKPEDRLYHAADNTWWRRDQNGHIKYAASPEGWMQKPDSPVSIGDLRPKGEPMYGVSPFRELYGAWPGEETDDECERILEDLS